MKFTVQYHYRLTLSRDNVSSFPISYRRHVIDYWPELMARALHRSQINCFGHGVDHGSISVWYFCHSLNLFISFFL